MNIQFSNRDTGEVLLSFVDNHIFERAFSAVLTKTYFAPTAIRAGYIAELSACVDNERGTKTLSRNTMLVLYNIITNELTQNFAKAMCSSLKALHDNQAGKLGTQQLSDVSIVQTAHLSKLLSIICEALYNKYAITMTVIRG